MTNPLEEKLQALHRDNQPAPAFADALEQQLRTLSAAQPTADQAPVKRWPVGMMRRAATLAAALALTVTVVMTIPPLRTLAEEILQFFVPGTGYVLPGNENAYGDTVMVSTLPEAEALAGFPAIQWRGGGFNILAVSAAPGYIQIGYERENDRGVLMHLSQWRTGSRPEQSPVSGAADVIQTQVHGVDAQFVAGAPFGENPVWRPDHYRQLRWEKDGFSYHLRVAEDIAASVDDVVKIAESLR